jgi:hypothetical protein
MKNKFTIFALLLILSNVSYSQNKNSFGINTGMVIPSMDNLKLMGFQFGGIGRINLKSSSFQIATGLYYTMIKGKTVTYSWFSDDKTIIEIIKYPSFKRISFFIGPQYSFRNAYLLPEISCNSNIAGSKINDIFDKERIRFGFSMSTGYLFPLGSDDIQIDICSKISLMNVIGKENGEESAAVFQLSAGIIFKTP